MADPQTLQRGRLEHLLKSRELVTAVPIVAPTLEESEAQWEKIAGAQADIVEWRLDQLALEHRDDREIAALAKRLREKYQIPVLGTWRTEREGGALRVESPTAYQDLVRAAAHWADMVDIEIHRSGAPALISELKDTTLVVASHHRFEPPVDGAQLRREMEEMLAAGAAVAKAASMVETAEDLRQIFAVQDWASDLGIPCVTIGMGAKGRNTRLGKRALANAFSFATLGKSSAPGQPSLEELRASVGER